MKVTEIIQKSQELSADWLEREMLMDAENCGCDRCLKIIEAIKDKSNPTHTQ